MTPIHHMYVSAGVVAPPTGPWRVSGSTLVGTAPAFDFAFSTKTFFIRPDGLKFFTLRQSNTTVRRYSMSTAWDISTLSYDGASFDGNINSFLVDLDPKSLWFNPAGTKMYAIDRRGTPLKLTIYEFTLSIAWNPSTRTFISSFDFTGIDIDLVIGGSGLVMKSDLSALFIGDAQSGRVLEFTFGIAGDVTTLSFAGKKFNRSNVDDGGVPHTGLFLKSDGTRLFSSTSVKIFESDMTVAFDVSTASYNTFFYDNFGNDGVSASRQFWKIDGTRYYVLRDDGLLNQYDT